MNIYVIDQEAVTIKRFGPNDGPDGVDVPLGLVESEFTIGKLRNDFDEVGLSERPLDEVVVHESVHRIDALLSADAFFREKTRIEAVIENIEKQIAALPEDDPQIFGLKERDEFVAIEFFVILTDERDGVTFGEMILLFVKPRNSG